MTIKVNFNDTKFTVTKKRRTTDLKALALTRVKVLLSCPNKSGPCYVIKRNKNDGWFVVRVTGDHRHFKHSLKSGIVTVPHPIKERSTTS
ncbi:type II toxin-antitoxin system HicA family toxin [Ligilactobacillus murinus]|uniref:type II toxin-antitoxin system HicA family toxin n=1 Tax=Ligilactobacillus murinus TaxID=1622 RepID=UPI00296B338D|nr:type II toxin-antitoxin system HicA family toxin [Ligilactobacillus murinus]WOY89049.1 type II toxin-antitoxin system HicA family toxin [Ligilactobacillus murinus]